MWKPCGSWFTDVLTTLLICMIRLSYSTNVVLHWSIEMRYLPLLIWLLFPIRVLAQAPCVPPIGFKDAPHPSIAPAEQLVSHTEQILIPRPMSVVSAAMKKPLEKTIGKSNSLPGVSGDYMLTKGPYGAIGSRRIVCLTDGTTTEEEALERDDSVTSGHFRYIVWNYTTPKGRPVSYGVGDFKTVQQDPGHTLVTWTYSFKLKSDTFPGEFGAVGRWLFKVWFLDRDYGAMMKGVLQGYQETAGSMPSVSPPAPSR
jgi:hypothetical protein